MQIPPFSSGMFLPSKEEVEERERELEEDATGLPPKEYLADWEQIDRPVRL